MLLPDISARIFISKKIYEKFQDQDTLEEYKSIYEEFRDKKKLEELQNKLEEYKSTYTKLFEVYDSILHDNKSTMKLMMNSMEQGSLKIGKNKLSGGGEKSTSFSDKKILEYQFKKSHLKTTVKKILEILKKYYNKMINTLLIKPIKKSDTLTVAISLYILNVLGTLSIEDIKLIDYCKNLDMDDNTVLAIHLSNSQKDIRALVQKKYPKKSYSIQAILRLKKDAMYRKFMTNYKLQSDMDIAILKEGAILV